MEDARRRNAQLRATQSQTPPSPKAPPSPKNFFAETINSMRQPTPPHGSPQQPPQQMHTAFDFQETAAPQQPPVSRASPLLQNNNVNVAQSSNAGYMDSVVASTIPRTGQANPLIASRLGRGGPDQQQVGLANDTAPRHLANPSPTVSSGRGPSPSFNAATHAGNDQGLTRTGSVGSNISQGSNNEPSNRGGTPVIGSARPAMTRAQTQGANVPEKEDKTDKLMHLLSSQGFTCKLVMPPTRDSDASGAKGKRCVLRLSPDGKEFLVEVESSKAKSPGKKLTFKVGDVIAVNKGRSSVLSGMGGDESLFLYFVLNGKPELNLELDDRNVRDAMVTGLWGIAAKKRLSATMHAPQKL
jgi:hypothetical protein